MKHIFTMLAAAALLASCQRKAALTVDAVNPTDLERNGESVEIPWATVVERLGSVDPQRVLVFNDRGEPQAAQPLYKGMSQPQALLFQVSVPAQGSAAYVVKKGRAKRSATGKAFGRLVPERKDDFAWENNRIAFRMYGPALMASDGPSNGIDVWCKRTEALVVNRWYRQDLAGEASYHVDHGEGLDCYKVGRTLGCGALAPYVNGKLVLGNNFVLSSVLDSGPLRISFELRYAPLEVDGSPVVEVRRISLDANAQLNRITEIFIGGKDMAVAMGIVLKDVNAAPASVKTANPAYKQALNVAEGYVAYTENADRLKGDTTSNGVIYTAIVAPEGLESATVEGSHVLAVSRYKADEPFTYYAGAGWSKGGFASEQDWQAYVAAEALKLRNPIQLRFR